MGILGVQKIKTPGNVMNCPENRYNFFFTHPTPGGSGGGVEGQNLKSPVNFMNCRENRSKNLPPPPKGVAVGILGGLKTGKCHELSRKSIQIFVYPSHPGGSGGGGWGSKFQKSGKFHELSRKSIKKNPPKGVAVVILGGQKIKSPGNVMNCREK